MPGIDRDQSPAALADALAQAVRDAGPIALGKFRAQVRNWTKGNDSPVCEADIEVDQFLRTRLHDIAPEYGWLSEESVDDPARLDAARVWIVDPIDGTRAFIAGRTDWSIAAALVENGRPIAAAIFAPASDGFFTAAKGGGARLDNVPLDVGAGQGASVIRAAGPVRCLDALAAPGVALQREPKVFSLALRLARVAAGMLDVAFASANSHDWDVAAADLILHEAGAVLTDFDGAPPVYNRAHPVHPPLIATSNARHGEVLELLRRQKHVPA